MDSNLIIKNLEPKDFHNFNILMQEVHKLHATNRSDVYKDTQMVISLDDFHQIIYSDEKLGIGAYINSQLVGICISTTKIIPPNIAWHSRRIGVIDAFCVQAEFRHLGIGTKLFHSIQALLKEKGIQSIELTVWDFNRSAFQFYENNGMTPRSTTMELKL